MAYSNLNFDRSERVDYDKFDYPVYIRKGRLSAYPNFSAESHWHDDLEFIAVLSGVMQYNVNGEKITLCEGEGIFVNTRQLHFGYSETKSECVFLCVLLHPTLLCSSRAIERKYVTPVLFNEHIPFCRLRRTCEWEGQILFSIEEMYEAREDRFFELKIQRAFYEVWTLLCENLLSVEREQVVQNHRLSALKEMIAFVCRNYREKLSLSEIAKAGKVGKTTCCHIFKRYANKTPNEFLTDTRLRKAVELLKTTDMTVQEIGYEVGFCGASYFVETFRKYYGVAPNEYRKGRVFESEFSPRR